MKHDIDEKVTGTSLDISAENREKLRQMLPSVFTEVKNDKGEVVESIDFEKLKAELGTFSEYFENRKEHYGMEWPGKKDALKLIQTSSAATLKPCREESEHFDTTENLFIEGDNLEVLKLLQKSYYGKVKTIFIDPPYNTGKEFIYPDNFAESLETYLEYAGMIDNEGKKFSTNTANEGRFHTKWLNMMYPRLYLARNLLRDDGVIFISIDDNEVENLRKICDEIFGEDNFLSQIVWKKRSSPDARTVIGCVHDYILCYVKNSDASIDAISKISLSDERKSAFVNYDNDERGVWASVDMTGQTGRAPKTQYYKVKLPSGREIDPPVGRAWGISLQTFNEMLADKRIWFGKDGDSVPRMKRFLTESEGQVVSSFWDMADVGSNDEANKDLRLLFGEVNIFDNPKPIRLIKRILEISKGVKPKDNVKEENIILDFFAGSATTAHAFLDFSKAASNGKFIMVQLPEPCAEESEAYKAGYKTIADIGKERIRRVIKKLNDEDNGKLDLEDNAKQDRGFKVLKLDRSNFKQWQKLEPGTAAEKIVEQLELSVDHVNKAATQEDLLYEVLIKAGFMPTEKIETKEIAGKKVFSIADGSLLIFFEKDITKELIEAVASSKPMQFICLDSAFGGNDQLKANAVQTFKALNQGKDKEEQILFKTI